jgi:hypothetical protein
MAKTSTGSLGTLQGEAERKREAVKSLFSGVSEVLESDRG